MINDSNEINNSTTEPLINSLIKEHADFIKYSTLKKFNNYSLSSKIIMDYLLTEEDVLSIKNICTDLIIDINIPYFNLPINFSEILNLETLNLGDNFFCREKLNIDLKKLTKLKMITWSKYITINGIREYLKYNEHLKEITVFPSVLNNCSNINEDDIKNISSSCRKFVLTPCFKDTKPVFLDSKINLNLKLLNSLVSFDLGNDWILPLTDEMFELTNLEEILFGKKWCYDLDKQMKKFSKLKRIVFGSLYEGRISMDIILNLPNLEEIQVSEAYWVQNFEYLNSIKNNNKKLKFKNHFGMEFTSL